MESEVGQKSTSFVRLASDSWTIAQNGSGGFQGPARSACFAGAVRFKSDRVETCLVTNTGISMTVNGPVVLRDLLQLRLASELRETDTPT
jgi:hypothetical protein